MFVLNCNLGFISKYKVVMSAAAATAFYFSGCVFIIIFRTHTPFTPGVIAYFCVLFSCAQFSLMSPRSYLGEVVIILHFTLLASSL